MSKDNAGALLMINSILAMSGLTVDDFIDAEMDSTKTEEEKIVSLFHKNDILRGAEDGNKE
jgi:hypothetical protein